MAEGKRTAAEWVTFAISCAVIAALIALILAEASDGNAPADVAVRAAAAERRGGQYYVPVEVENRGDETAANVQIVASLEVRGETADADQVIDFLAGGESETLVFAFDDDPDRGELTVTVAGYAEP